MFGVLGINRLLLVVLCGVVVVVGVFFLFGFFVVGCLFGVVFGCVFVFVGLLFGVCGVFVGDLLL